MRAIMINTFPAHSPQPATAGNAGNAAGGYRGRAPAQRTIKP
jgi:hypothetical protein